MKGYKFILIPLFVMLFVNTIYAQDWLSGWDYRKQISIDYTKVDANLTDFPVLVKLDNTNFDFAKALANGYDIRFTSSDGTTLLKYERERHSSPNAEYWVKIPSVSSTTNTFFYMYYGNSSAGDGADVSNVWNNYKLKYSFEESSGNVLDSSPLGNNGVLSGGVSRGIPGKIGKGYEFDGVNGQVVTVNNIGITGGSTRTVSFWAYPVSTASSSNSMVEFGSSGTGQINLIAFNTSTNLSYAAWACDYGPPEAPLPLSNWSFVTMVYDGTNVKLYVNGELKGSEVKTCVNTGAGKLVIAEYSKSGGWDRFWNGRIDHLTVTGLLRSDAWIKASYHTGDNSLLSYGTEEIPIVPPSITTSSATSITSSSATLNGNITDLGEDTDCDFRGFVWGISSLADPGDTQPSSSSYSNNWTESGTFLTGAFNHSILDLNPGITYYFRAVAHNTAGWSYGNELSFITNAIAPTVTTQTATDITTISATGHGTITATGGSSISQHGVYWSESEDPTIADAHTTEGSAGTGSFSSNITGLIPGRRYHYRAYATNSAGTGYGENQTFVAIASITVNWNDGNVQTITVRGDVQFEFVNGKAGGVYRFFVRQDEVGGRVITFPSSVIWPEGITPSNTNTSQAVDMFLFTYDGTDYFGEYNLDYKR